VGKSDNGQRYSLSVCRAKDFIVGNKANEQCHRAGQKERRCCRFPRLELDEDLAITIPEANSSRCSTRSPKRPPRLAPHPSTAPKSRDPEESDPGPQFSESDSVDDGRVVLTGSLSYLALDDVPTRQSHVSAISSLRTRRSVMQFNRRLANGRVHRCSRGLEGLSNVHAIVIARLV
jgi:hypothetical protein